jgi:uncharacterized membrane protein
MNASSEANRQAVAKMRSENLKRAREAKAERREALKPLGPGEIRCVLRLPRELTKEQQAKFVTGVQELIDGGVITLPDPKWER